jgi:toxin ParE1/3/4
MAKYYLTNLAVEDLTKIWDYTYETWSEKQADKYYDLLLVTFNEIAINPKLGKKYDVTNKGVLGLKTGEHVVFYQIISENEIEIARILHGMMDLKTKI